MQNQIDLNSLTGYSYILMISALVIVGSILVFIFSHYFAKYLLLGFIKKFFGKKSSGLANIMYKNHLYQRIAYLIPAILLYHYAYLFDIESHNLKLYLASLIKLLTVIYLQVGVALVLSSILNCINDRYRSLAISKQKPIKSYIQVLKIIIFILTGVLIVSTVSDKSPLVIFTGVSAATAVLVLVFKDSILGFVASIQLAAYDMVRIGDWIEMPNYGADGEIKDISLNTVKVQNFDKTIVTIPSYALLTSGLKNWRGMQEAGGRRVKQSILIDITTIKICDDKLIDYIIHTDALSAKLPKSKLKNKVPMTNIGIFRMYIEAYLRQHPGVHKELKILIRQQQGTSTGLPLELYFFTNETESEQYEAIQADVFDHLYAALPLFDLRAFQLT